jgi:hypothetical protein
VTDYNFRDDARAGEPTATPKEPVSRRSETGDPNEQGVELTEFDAALIKAGRDLGALSFRTGEINSILQQAAQGQAAFQAEYAAMGHQRWRSRAQQLAELLPEYTGFREVCAYTGWDMPKAAENVFGSWRSSPAHWVWVNGQCDIFGYAIARSGQTKLWYACAIFADRKKV